MVWSLKLMLFIGVLYFFVIQISRIEWNQILSVKLNNPLYLLLLIILLPLNWGFELLKWQRILKVNQINYTLKELIYSLLSGVTTGIVTPNRIGNFIGRMLYFKGKVRGQVILGTLYSNFAQFLITIVFGLIGLFFLKEMLLESFTAHIYSILFVIALLSMLFYFMVPFIKLPGLKVINQKQNVLTHFQRISKSLVFPLFIFSGLRYLVFSFQFFLMLMAFGIEPNLMIYAGILLVYLISTLTPSLFFGKLVIRETAGLLILSLFIGNDAIIIVSSLLLWFLNVGSPSLIGLFFILRRKSYVNT